MVLFVRCVACRAAEQEVAPLISQPVVARCVQCVVRWDAVSFLRSEMLYVAVIAVQPAFAVNTFAVLVGFQALLYLCLLYTSDAADENLFV